MASGSAPYTGGYPHGTAGRALRSRHNITKRDQGGSLTPFTEIGRTGLRQWGGYVLEEWLAELQGKRGAEMYREILDQDPIIGSILYVVEMLVRRVTWSVEPASSALADKQAAEFLSQCLFEDLEYSWNETLVEILSFIPYGYSLHEVVFKRRNGPSGKPGQSSLFTDGKVGIGKLPIRSQDALLHWEFDDHDDWTAMVHQPPPTYNTYRIPKEKALLFRTKIHKGNPEGRSVLRNCVKPYYFKKGMEALQGIGVERDLAGLPTLKPPPGVDIWNTNDPAMSALLASAQAMVTQVRRDELEGVIVPADWTFELLKGGGSRSFNVLDIIKYYDQRMAMTLMADFVTLGQDKVGSYALAGTKKDLFSASLESYLDQIGATFNTYLSPMLFRLNGGWPGMTDFPKLTHGEVEDIDLATISELLTAMGAAGAPVFAGDSEDKLMNFLLDKIGAPAVVADDTSENE